MKRNRDDQLKRQATILASMGKYSDEILRNTVEHCAGMNKLVYSTLSTFSWYLSNERSALTPLTRLPCKQQRIGRQASEPIVRPWPQGPRSKESPRPPSSTPAYNPYERPSQHIVAGVDLVLVIHARSYISVRSMLDPSPTTITSADWGEYLNGLVDTALWDKMKNSASSEKIE